MIASHPVTPDLIRGPAAVAGVEIRGISGHAQDDGSIARTLSPFVSSMGETRVGRSATARRITGAGASFTIGYVSDAPVRSGYRLSPFAPSPSKGIFGDAPAMIGTDGRGLVATPRDLLNIVNIRPTKAAS